MAAAYLKAKKYDDFNRLAGQMKYKVNAAFALNNEAFDAAKKDENSDGSDDSDGGSDSD